MDDMDDTHILIVEDEPDIADILRDYLVREGYGATVLDNGDAAFAFFRDQKPDLILLDLMIPGMDGKTLCREIRKTSQVPILMITAKVEEIDRIIGFELGADDYVCKPFSPREVVARVGAVLRRTRTAGRADGRQGHERIAGPIRLCEDTRLVTIDGRQLSLTPSEFNIMAVLIQYPGRVYSRTQLIEKVQGYEFEGYDRTIDFHIKNLRKKISVLLPGQKIILSSYGIGYKLVPPE